MCKQTNWFAPALRPKEEDSAKIVKAKHKLNNKANNLLRKAERPGKSFGQLPQNHVANMLSYRITQVGHGYLPDKKKAKKYEKQYLQHQREVNHKSRRE